MEIELQRCSRKCAKTDRELLPGEVVYSALVEEGNNVQRVDYSAEGWQEPPGNTIAWWKSQLPGGSSRRTQWAPNEVILDYFHRLVEDPAQADVRFVLALLMVRRRIVRLEQSETDASGQEFLVLYCPRDETELRVPVVMPSDARATEIQAELSRLLVTPGTPKATPSRSPEPDPAAGTSAEPARE